MIGTVSNYLLMTGETQERIKVYTDSVNSLVYVCDSIRGSALTDPVRRVRKCHNDTSGNIEETWTNAGYVSPATSLIVVAALSYS